MRHTKTSFQETALEPFWVKGRSRRVQAADVGPLLHATERGTARAQLPLIGRRRELAQLRDAIDAARRGRGALIELIGETGSGKSRLLHEARVLGEEMRVLRATCEVYSRETPYAIWRELLRQLLDLAADDPPDVVLERLEADISAQPELLRWIGLIAIVLDVPAPLTAEIQQLAPDSSSGKLREVVLRFVRRRLVKPTLVEIEHVQLMDAASVALFEALARELDSSAWVVLVTRRDVPGGLTLAGADHRRIELGPLDQGDARTLALATREATHLPPHVVDLAVERSGGSPEFLLDLLSAAAAGQLDELPDNVGAATMARIDALEPRDGAVVRRAAVLGLTFHPRRLADVLGDDQPLPDEGFWDRLSDVFTREANGQVRFRQPAVQETAYASLSFKLRRELHAALGLRLEREPDADPAVLSQHFALAGDYVRAHRYAMRAARRATERFSHADAAQLYRRAIDTGRAAGLVADAPAFADAWEQLGNALRCIGELGAASRAFTQARRLSHDPVVQARLCDGQAEVAERCETLTAAVRWLKRGLRDVAGVSGTGATIVRALIRAHLGGIRNRQGRWSEAARVFREAIAEAESVGELPALARACYGLDWALVGLRRSEEATNSWRALEIYEQLGDLEHQSTVLNNLGMFAYFEGRWEEAIELYRRAGECSERAGTPADVARSDCNIGEILSDQGHLNQAEEYLDRARRVWIATGERQSVAFADLLLARLAVRRGQVPVAVPKLEAAMDEFKKLSMDAYARFARALLVEAEALRGDPARARRIARQELKTADRERPLLQRACAVAAVRLGREPLAVAELNEALVEARTRRVDYEIAATIDALDAIGSTDADLLAERDEILARLRIVRLPTLSAI